MKTYKLAKGWAIFIYIVAPATIVLFTFLAISPFFEHNKGGNDIAWVTIPMSLFMIGLMSFAIREAVVGMLTISEDSIILKGAMRTRQLNFDQIKGYRVDDSYIYVLPKSKQQKTIKISNYLKGKDEIVHWLGLHFEDLDLVELINEQNEMMENTNFGDTEIERSINLEKTTKLTKTMNWAGVSIAIWTLIFFDPYELSILLCIAFPLVSLIIIRYSKGMIRIDEFNNTLYPSLAGAVLMPSLAILIRGIVDFEVFNYGSLWLPCFSITGLMLLTVYLGKTGAPIKKAKHFVSACGIALLFFAYSVGTILTLNGHFDHSLPVTYQVKILSKDVVKGKTKSYHFDLEPWGPIKEKNQVRVKYKLFEKKAIQQTVQVHSKKGWLHIPWFYLSE